MVEPSFSAQTRVRADSSSSLVLQRLPSMQSIKSDRLIVVPAIFAFNENYTHSVDFAEYDFGLALLTRTHTARNCERT
jgi:hypothetical protein